MQAAARSYPVDQLDRPVEEGEEGDGDRYRKKIGRKTATAGEDVSEREHISIMRPSASRVCVRSRDGRGDFVKMLDSTAIAARPAFFTKRQTAAAGDPGRGKQGEENR